MALLIPIIIMGALGLLFSTGLVFAYKKLRVYEDPKIEVVAGVLPQANCGACGYSGCRAFAEALVKGQVPVNGCPVGGEEVAQRIANLVGVKAEHVVKKVARVHCRGTSQAAKDKGHYLGLKTCLASHLIGGNKQCSFGCLGLGDCVRACPFEAMYMDQDGLPVVIEEKCTACGKCVDACPRNIMELHPVNQQILVFCRSEDRGPLARRLCKNACIACGICVRACPDAIILENYLAKIIDYKKIPPDKIAEIEKCPTGAIGRLKKDNEG
ncbi:MAG: RnfABCDGE type electron transport complex subunit B [Candidatus Aminicenantales bacterium]